MAFCTLVSNALVNPPIAETTTTGRNGTAVLTTAATLRKALASSTDVPPNFMMVGFMGIARSSLCPLRSNHRGHRETQKGPIAKHTTGPSFQRHFYGVKHPAFVS